MECIGQVIVSGWKGESGTEILGIGSDQTGKYLTLKEFRKSKETKENYSSETRVYLKDIEILWNLLRENCDIGRDYGCHFIWRLIIRKLNLSKEENLPEDYLVKHFLGFRQKDTNYYFKYYHYPIKVFEGLRIAYIFGKGKIVIHTKDDFDTILIKSGLK